jgi:hypothetical protein
MPNITMDDIVSAQASQGLTAELCQLAATGLVNMFDSRRQLFCDIYNRTGAGMARQGISHRYTMMTVLGLHRYQLSGHSLPLPIEPILDQLTRNTEWIESAGDLGLLLWTCAELSPDRLPQVYRRVSAGDALDRFEDAQQGATMEVAWYLTGLAAAWKAGGTDLPAIAEQITAARGILKKNCGKTGIYGHLCRSGRITGLARRRIGSFADQVYPTIAFARLAQALNDDDARSMALRTAQTMCRLQEPLGEWCWHYDSVGDRVVNRYPVYSVHQHAMGPMMLFEAAEATGCDFSHAIYKGLAWISGNNELGLNLIEPTLGLVWRSVYLNRIDAYADAARRLIGSGRGAAKVRPHIRYECRPYELGWLLYAFAGK